MNIKWNNKNIDVLGDYDCCVVGGGTAGAIAGITAANEGLNTIIIEKQTSLGGTQVSALVSPTMPTYVKGLPITELLEQTLVENGLQIFPKEYQDTLDNATKERPSATPTMKWTDSDVLPIVLEEMFTDRSGKILYDVNVVDVIKIDDKISHLILFGTEGFFAITAKTFVDASGDAILARFSNEPVLKGDENGENQFTSLRFEVGGIDVDKMYTFFNDELKQTLSNASLPHFTFMVTHQGREEVLKPLFDKALNDGVITKDEYVWIQAFTVVSKHGCMTFNCPRLPGKKDILNPFFRSESYITGRQMIKRYINFLNIYVPGFEKAYLNKVATQIGVRESYRFVGEYVLKFDDYLNKKKFADGVVQADYWIDVHKDDHDPSDEFTYNYKDYFEIPYRSLVSKHTSNVIYAGRNISCDFLTHSSIRIQPQCRYMGEIAGYACKLSVENQINLNKINGKEIKEHFYGK